MSSAGNSPSAARNGQKSSPLSGVGPVPLLLGYLAVALAPLALAYAQDLPARPFPDELSSALVLMAFAMLLMEFVLSGRFRGVSGRIGIDMTMCFHQRIARYMLVLILIHPFLYTLPFGKRLPWDTGGQASLLMGGEAMVSGVLAWLLLPALVWWAISQRTLPFRYETWRLCHGLGAAVIALLGLHHAVAGGRYSSDGVLAWFWAVMVGIAMLTLLNVYVFRPLRQLRHPYRVVSVTQASTRTWELVLEPSPPERQEQMTFLAGQFVWLTVGRTPFSITEHPFSICSCPAELPRLSFIIKEAGDFTSTVGTIQPGTTAYLDGPHGHLVLEGRKGAGLVFIAGGSGLAPVMSMLRQLRVERDPRPVILIYGNRTADQILYQEELEDMKSVLDITVHHVLGEPPPGWQGRGGCLDLVTLERCLPEAGRDAWLYAVCGPAPMIDSVENALAQLNVPLRQILTEKFSQH